MQNHDNYITLHPTLSTLVSITRPLYSLQASLISSILSLLHTAIKEEPVPDKPEANAPDSKASIAIFESKFKVEQYNNPFKVSALK